MFTTLHLTVNHFVILTAVIMSSEDLASTVLKVKVIIQKHAKKFLSPLVIKSQFLQIREYSHYF